MKREQDNIKWLSKWFLSACDGDWEHENMIKISTVDNPGWSVTIDLNEHPLQLNEIDGVSRENAEDDWYFYEVKDGIFNAAGDMLKMDFLLGKFRELVENHNE